MEKGGGSWSGKSFICIMLVLIVEKDNRRIFIINIILDIKDKLYIVFVMVLDC